MKKQMCAWAFVLCVPVMVMAQEAKPATAPSVAPAVKAAETTVPTINELDGLKLDRVVLSIENLQLKLAQGQAELEKMRTDAQPFIQSLQKPGYQLAKDQQGNWIYQAEPAKTDAPKTPEKK